MKKNIKIINSFIVLLVICFLLGLPQNSQAEEDSVQLRAITYNVYSFDAFPAESLKMQGYCSNKSDKSIVGLVRTQIPARLALELAIYTPDIISFQEARGEANVAKVAELLGMNYTFFEGSPGADFPGAIITRYEIIESASRPIVKGECPAELFTRHWGRALIKTEMGIVAVHTAHLMPGSSNSEIRIREIEQILMKVDEDIRKGYCVLVLGDLNHLSDTEEYEKWMEAGFTDTWAMKNSCPAFTIPSTGARQDGENYRIDYILALGAIADELRGSKILYEGSFRTYSDSSSSFALSDHIPVISVFVKEDGINATCAKF